MTGRILSQSNHSLQVYPSRWKAFVVAVEIAVAVALVALVSGLMR